LFREQTEGKHHFGNINKSAVVNIARTQILKVLAARGLTNATHRHRIYNEGKMDSGQNGEGGHKVEEGGSKLL